MRGRLEDIPGALHFSAVNEFDDTTCLVSFMYVLNNKSHFFVQRSPKPRLSSQTI